MWYNSSNVSDANWPVLPLMCVPAVSMLDRFLGPDSGSPKHLGSVQLSRTVAAIRNRAYPEKLLLPWCLSANAYGWVGDDGTAEMQFCLKRG